jgi:hypothetical protein
MKTCLRILAGTIFLGLTVISRADHITVNGSVSGEWDTDTVRVEGGPALFGGIGGGAGYVGTYENNLDVNPEFEYPPDYNYHLSLNSPVMNMGAPDTAGLFLPSTDLDGESRIDLHVQVIDMGCYEVQWVGISSEFKVQSSKLIHVFPNPFREECFIGYDLSESGRVCVEIFDLTGRIVNILNEESNNEGFGEITWDGTDQNGHDVQPGN